MSAVERVVFLSLVLDLFAFTIPLPLFPRIIEWYTKREAGDPHGFLSRTLGFVSATRALFYTSARNSQKWDVVLLGGMMGSVFSTLQFIVSPIIGSLSDKYGRKRILLLTMIGNILSAVVWVKSTTFATYMLSRVIGGLSEGNVQLAIAILSDVTTLETRSKALAHVGIAFAICFIVGPPIGAYFAARPLPLGASLGLELNVYAAPALLTLVLLLAETAFLAVALPETRGRRAEVTAPAPKANGHAKENGSGNGAAAEKPKPSSRASTPAKRLALLARLQRLHFLFLGVFSGVEFTLTFLTFDLFDWNNTQNGMLIGSIGIVSAALQGGYVRRALARVGELRMAARGASACALGLCALAALPGAGPAAAQRLLQLGAVCLAFTSATVVNSLTAHAALQCDEVEGEGEPRLAKGRALGRFRSAGQLGRALGPLLACGAYWTFGPARTYGAGAALMGALTFYMSRLERSL